MNRCSMGTQEESLPHAKKGDGIRQYNVLNLLEVVFDLSKHIMRVHGCEGSR